MLLLRLSTSKINAFGMLCLHFLKQKAGWISFFACSDKDSRKTMLPEVIGLEWVPLQLISKMCLEIGFFSHVDKKPEKQKRAFL